MATLELQGISKSYNGGEFVIEPSSLSIADGEFLALLGPSGCGKSTLLRMIAGLESVSSGEILIDSRSVTSLPGKSRDVAMVFQDYALYPQMTARLNIAFPLQLRKMPQAELAEQVAQIADLLDIGQILDRVPAQMSGGQRQRVAMARALVRRPKVLLLDEPLSNLDAALRDQMRSEIRRITRETGVTTVYVTHDQVEAMTMADRVAVLNRGRIEQLAPPLELYTAPATTFVAGFLGSPPMNLLPASVRDGGTIELNASAQPGLATLTVRPLGEGTLPEQIFVGLRPEHLGISVRPPAPDGSDTADALQWRGRLISAEAIGSETLFRMDLGFGPKLRAKVPGIMPLAAGSEVFVTARRENILVYERAGGQLIPCVVSR